MQHFGIRHEYIATYEFDNPDYVRNDPNRCFHCKDELFTRLEEVGNASAASSISSTASTWTIWATIVRARTPRGKHQVKAPLVDAS